MGGLLKFEKTETDLGEIPVVGMKIMMNVGNPETAFTFGQLPNEGIGLARLEFVINNAIGVHPKALLDYDTLDAETKALIDAKMKGYGTPTEFYVQKNSRGCCHPCGIRLSQTHHCSSLRLQVQRVQEPDRRRAVRARRGKSDDRLPRLRQVHGSVLRG